MGSAEARSRVEAAIFRKPSTVVFPAKRP
jgi:hypothetical protein